VAVELLAGNARLNRGGHVGDVHIDNRVHFRAVDADATLWRIDLPFEGRTRTRRDQRHTVLTAKLHDLNDFVFAANGHYRIGGTQLDAGRRLAELLPDSLFEPQAFAEQLTEFFYDWSIHSSHPCSD
jgi:hypothetical protein